MGTMQADEEFQQLMRRVRAGDGDAATELVRQYEPEIRRVVRVRLRNPGMHRVLDTMDICQSVLANFFARAALGQFELEDPAQLLKLLVTMARNKLRDQVRRHHARRRDQRRVAGDGMEALEAVGDGGTTPSQIVAGKEMIQAIQRLLSKEERFLAEQRALGREWADIAAELGAKPDALRIKLARAIDRVAPAIGIE